MTGPDGDKSVATAEAPIGGNTPTKRKTIMESRQKTRQHFSRPEYELELIQRKEEAFNLRTAKVDKEQQDMIANMLTQITQRVAEDEAIGAKEETSKSARTEEIERMRTSLNQFLKEERLRQGEEGLIREIFEEDVERMKLELAAKFENGGSAKISEDGSGCTETSRKRKAVSEVVEQPEAKRPNTFIPSSQANEESDVETSGSYTVGRSTQSQEVVVSEHEAAEAASCPVTPERQRRSQRCRVCGNYQPRSVGRNGKGVRCECISMFNVLWQVQGGVDGEDDQEAESDVETVDWEFHKYTARSRAQGLLEIPETQQSDDGRDEEDERRPQ